MILYVIAMVLLLITVATYLIGHSPSWFMAALGFLMYGEALRWISWQSYFSAIRRGLRLSQMGAMRLRAMTHVLAGGLFLIGAITSFRLAFAAIVAVVALSWMWLQGYVVWNLRGSVTVEKHYVKQSWR